MTVNQAFCESKINAIENEIPITKANNSKTDESIHA